MLKFYIAYILLYHFDVGPGWWIVLWLLAMYELWQWMNGY